MTLEVWSYLECLVHALSDWCGGLSIHSNFLFLQLVQEFTNTGITESVVAENVDRYHVPFQWVFLVGVVVLILVGVVRSVGLMQHHMAIRMAFSNIKFQFEQMDKGLGINYVLLLQILVSCIVVALGVFLFQPFDFNFTLVKGFRLYLLILMAVCLAYTLKYFIHYIMGLVLQAEILGSLMVVGLSHMMYAVTLLVFPLLIAWYYLPSVEGKFYLRIILLAVMAVFVVWRLIKSIFIYNRYFPFAKIYIIIYLCTLEITPLLVIGRFIAKEM